MAAAEEAFAEHGLEGVSMRQLTSKAGVNLAAISYHFGTKEAVVSAIFDRRVGPIISRRLELLARCVAGPDDVPILEQVLEAYLLPLFEFAQEPGGRKFLQLRSRLVHEQSPEIRKLHAHFDPASRMYIDTLQRILPHLRDEEVHWRFFFMLGAYLHVFADSGHLASLSRGLCDSNDYRQVLKHLVPVLASGFRTPSVYAEGTPDAGPARANGRRKVRVD